MQRISYLLPKRAVFNSYQKRPKYTVSVTKFRMRALMPIRMENKHSATFASAIGMFY